MSQAYPPLNQGYARLNEPQRPYLHPQLSSSQSIVSQGAGDWRQRARPLQRGKTRRVKLTKDGHFIALYPVAPPVVTSLDPRYLQEAERAGRSEEFTHLRYSAATCDPNDFTPANGWSLRPRLYNRETELLIAATSYNEDKILTARTLHSIFTNVRDIVRSKHKVWKQGQESGQGGWQRIVVTHIADGIDPADKGMLDLLATLGVYQDNIMKRQVDGKDTVAHIFEFTTQLSVDAKPSLVVPSSDNDKANLVPVQFIFCLKQKNAKKINSHRWLFNAFARQLNPEVIILIDIGTKPGPRSLLSLWECFHYNEHVGGCCGEIYVQTNSGKKLFNPLVAAQNFEYKISNALDKPLESAFGYVSVLPGAFSAYRWRALQGRPLEQYFHGDQTNPADEMSGKGASNFSIWTANMFLAEDRILCFELVAKTNARWRLTYVQAAKGETDCPEGVAELIGQRRRWLNGSFAASVYSIAHFIRIYRTSHGYLRLFALHVQLIYNVVSLVFTWFSLANLWLSFFIVTRLLPDNSHIYIFYNETITHWVNLALTWLYAATIALQFVLALGNKPKAEVGTYIASFCIFALLAAYLFACAILLVVRSFLNISFQDATTALDKINVLLSGTYGVLFAALMSTFGIYIISSLMFLDPWHLITSFIQYLLIVPSFTNILMVFSFSNLHDISWGTKGSDKADELPSISSNSKDGEKEASVNETVRTEADLETAFKATVQRALTPQKSVEHRAEPTRDDSNRTFRTRLVAIWLLTNGALVIAIQNANAPNTTEADLQAKTSAYFNVLLVVTAGLAAVRFLGCLWFWSIMVMKRANDHLADADDE